MLENKYRNKKIRNMCEGTVDKKQLKKFISNCEWIMIVTEPKIDFVSTLVVFSFQYRITNS